MRPVRDYYLVLASQTLSAFADNAFLMFIIGQLTQQQLAGALSEAAFARANAFYPAMLYIPFVLLAPVAGYVNDRFAKTRWLLGGNGCKLLGVAVAIGGLHAGVNLLAPAYLLIGIGACVYSPAKYGILPELLPRERLVKANGTMEMLTLVAILIGNLAGAVLIDSRPPLFCYNLLFTILAVAMLLNVLMAASPRHPEIRFARTLGDFRANTRALVTSPRLGRVLLGTGLFWFCGSVLKTNFSPWGLGPLGFADGYRYELFGFSASIGATTQIALLGLWLAVGVMIGSMLAGQLYRTGEVHATRRWGWGMALLILLLTGVTGTMAVKGMLILIGIAGGLFLIPLNATLQAECHGGALGKTIATQNFLENCVMLAGAGLVLGAASAGAGPLAVFAGLACCLAGAVTLLRIPPAPEPRA
ncbi:MAG TPA: MFS transporter [bacterium]|nr:MFS transporter [bacterium]